MSRPALGAHVSTSGGLVHAFARGGEIGCEALQIFVKSPNQWRAKPLAVTEADAFRGARATAGAPPVVAHAAYLINLAAPDPEILAKSRAGLADELGRGAAIGLDGVVVHPGAHLGRGVDAALTVIAESLDALAAGLPTDPSSAPRILLELTAGQGTVVGHTLEQLAQIRSRAACRERIAYCLDTCHAFAAGYELGTVAAVEEFLAEVERHLGFELVACLHVNDSEGALGSKKDRHANIGQGKIALEGFRRLLSEPRLAGVPAILETPIGDDELGHARDLEALRALLAG
jgi:deoxyribonuclease-4